ncbi:hypothetical protein HDV01_006846 [Terramyces sp. JEL0728]|nr:hypothetical protein HDV01_006846 [Terramyces sp. JEL0728]
MEDEITVEAPSTISAPEMKAEGSERASEETESQYSDSESTSSTANPLHISIDIDGVNSHKQRKSKLRTVEWGDDVKETTHTVITKKKSKSFSKLFGKRNSSQTSLTSMAQSLHIYSEKIHRKKTIGKSYRDTFGEKESFELKRDFLILLAKDVAYYGVPTHRLEFLLESVGDSIGVPSTFFALPSLVMMSVKSNNIESQTYLLKYKQSFHMGKLSQVNDLCHDLLNGRLTIEEATIRLYDIRQQPTFDLWLNVITFPLTSAIFCLIGFGGDWKDALLSYAFGTIVGLLQILAIRQPFAFGYLFEFSSALIVTLLTNSFSNLLLSKGTCINTQKIILSGLAILLPGLTLTLSIVEISTRNMVCGTVRLFTALFTALLLGFGMFIGESWIFIAEINKKTCDGTVPIHWALYFPLVPLSAFVICVLFEAKKSQWWIIILVSSLGFGASTYSQNVFQFNSNIPSTFFGTFLIGLTSNFYARVTRDVSIAPILCGILMLVPGSFGVRSSVGFIQNDNTATYLASQMIVISMTITVGLFVATMIVWPIKGKGPSSTKFMLF